MATGNDVANQYSGKSRFFCRLLVDLI